MAPRRSRHDTSQRRRRGALREQREDEKFRAAAFFVIAAVVYMTGVLLWTAGELLLFGEHKTPAYARCWLLTIGGTGFGGYYMQCILFLLSFGSALVAKRLDALNRWRILVYGSGVGVIASLYILTAVQPGKFSLYRMTTLGCDVAMGGDKEGFINTHVTWLLVTMIVWFCGITATQFGLKLPERLQPGSNREGEAARGPGEGAN